MKTKNKSKDNNISAYKTFFAAVIAGFVLFYPWITYLKIWKLDEKAQGVFENYNGYIFDFFLHSKATFVLILAVFLLLVLVGENIFPDHILTDTPLRNKYNFRLYCCMALFALFVFLSCLFSENNTVSSNGSYSGGEGILTLISYPIICLGAMNYFCYQKSLDILKKVIILLSIITIVLTLIEFCYRPLLNLPFLKYIIAPKEYYSIVESMDNSNYLTSVALTFYNPNYYGGFCMLIFPFGISEYFRAKDKKSATTYLFLSAGIFFCVIAAKSSASFYLVLLENILLLLLERKQWSRPLLKAAVWFGVLTALLCIINLAVSGKLLEIGKNVLTNESNANRNEEIFYLKDIKIENNTLILYGQVESLKVCFENQEFSFYDTENQRLEYKMEEEGNFCFEDKRYQMISAAYQSDYFVFDLGYDDVVDFYIDEGRFWGIGQNGEKLMKVSNTSRFGERFYSLFTGRSYTWINSLPLLPETVLIGKGPGNFTYYFPQNDYVGLLNTHGSHKFVIDKPHNMYLQIWIDLGGIACLAIIAFFSCIICRYRRFCISKQAPVVGSEHVHWLFTCVMGFICYAVINDSIVTVTPLPCVLCGVLLSILPVPKSEQKDK